MVEVTPSITPIWDPVTEIFVRAISVYDNVFWYLIWCYIGAKKDCYVYEKA